MKPEDIPMGDRILPGDKCELCDAEIEVFDEVDEIVFLACPHIEDGDGHTEHNGIKKSILEAWGWKI